MDKVDTYDKEQLQAMGWLFDETETPDTAVRFVEQDLTSEQQMQVFKNLGWDVYVTDSKSFLSSTLTPEELERLKTTSAIILTDLNKIFLYGAQSGDYIRFYGMVNSNYIGGININPSTGLVSGVGSYRLSDVESVHFTKQTLTIPQQNTALSNIGLDFVVVDYSLFGTVLSDEVFEKVSQSNGIIIGYGDYHNSTVFLRGRASSSNKVFVCFSDTYSIVYTNLDLTTKRLNALTSKSILDGGVQYNSVQSLTDVQKQQARANIGVQSADELLADDNFIAQLKTKLGL